MAVPHIEFALVPLLMLADYYLTVAGAKLYAPTPEARAAYELNPHFKQQIASLALFNPAHLAIAGMVTLLLFWGAAIDLPLSRFLFGACVAVFGILVATHIANILTLLLERAWPEEVLGRQEMSYRVRLMVSSYRTLGLAIVPIGLFALVEPSSFSAGAALGAFALAALPLQWRANLTRSELDRKTVIGRRACGFCGQDEKAARRLFEARAGMICDECVDTCVEARHEQKIA